MTWITLSLLPFVSVGCGVSDLRHALARGSWAVGGFFVGLHGSALAVLARVFELLLLRIEQFVDATRPFVLVVVVAFHGAMLLLGCHAEVKNRDINRIVSVSEIAALGEATL